MSKPYAWRVLACLPILQGSACTNTSKDWQAQRRMGLYHSAMAHIIPEINDICSKDDYCRFADKLVRQAEAEARRQERTLASRQQGAVTLKRRLEQRGADFYERQRSRRAGQSQE